MESSTGLWFAGAPSARDAASTVPFGIAVFHAIRSRDNLSDVLRIHELWQRRFEPVIAEKNWFVTS